MRPARLGVHTAVRDSAAGIGLVLGVLYLFPVAAAVIPDHVLSRHLEQVAPMTAGLYIQATAASSRCRSPLARPWRARPLGTRRTHLGAAVLRLRDA